MTQVRVRFAPSPTGYFHIGSARTALFNWLYARHTQGIFILRIEDTDKERNTQEALDVLYHGLKWLGLDWDEGPHVGGDYGPYFQSERGDIYNRYLQRLRDNGRVYDKEGAVWLKISGEPQVIRDAVRGEVTRTEEKDFVIFRSNGMPVFHFVNVVDDIEMKITHVIRGEDHLSNTSKHVELFKAFGEPMPVFAHIPLILKTNGPGKMSKRDEGALIEDYEKKHFLPQAVRNYLCLLGWSPKDDREILDIDEIIKLFELENINKNNARFDEKKMAFMNAEYLRHMPIENFAWLSRPILTEAGVIPVDVNEDYFQAILRICQEKVRSFEDLPHFISFFFSEDYPVDEKAQKKLLSQEGIKTFYEKALKAFSYLDTFEIDALEKALITLGVESGYNSGQCMKALRFAVSGKDVGVSFFPMLHLLGKEKTCKRIEALYQRMA